MEEMFLFLEVYGWQLALIAVVVLGLAFAPVAKLQKRIKNICY